MIDSDALRFERCEPCRRTSPRVTADEARELGRLVPEWAVVTFDDIPWLQRLLRTKTYAQALTLTVRIGEMADAENHHPLIVLERRRVSVSWSTHAIGWLHRNDYILAARTDEIYAIVMQSEDEAGIRNTDRSLIS